MSQRLMARIKQISKKRAFRRLLQFGSHLQQLFYTLCSFAPRYTTRLFSFTVLGQTLPYLLLRQAAAGCC